MVNLKYNIEYMDLTGYFIICIFVRLSLAFSVYWFRQQRIQLLLAFICGSISVGSLYQYTVKTRTVGAFHNKVWWDHLRPIHAGLYALTTYGLMIRYPYAYLFLWLDTLIGVIGFLNK